MSGSSYYWRVTRRPDAVRLVEFPVPGSVVLSPKQMEYMAGEHSRELQVAARGGGKDFVAILKKVMRALKGYWRNRQNPNFNRAGFLWHLAVVACDADSLIDCRAKLTDLLPQIPGTGRNGTKNYIFNEKQERWHLFGKGELVVSLINLYQAQRTDRTKDEAESFRGPGFDDCLVTEAQKARLRMIESDIFPMVFRPGYPGNITLNGTPTNGWIDMAADQADPECEASGYFSNWKLWTATTFDNPLMDEQMAQQIVLEQVKNPWLFAQERLARRGVQMPSEAAADSPLTPGVLECCFSAEKLVITPGAAPLVAWDLFYGGDDIMVRTVWDKPTCGLVDVSAWDKKRFHFDVKSADYSGFIALFDETAARYPGCLQIYDATGPYGSRLYPHIPRRIRVKPVVRNNAVKNSHVSDFLARLEIRDGKGRSMGIKLPDPQKYPFADERQRQLVAGKNGLVEQILHYRCVTETRTGTRTVRWTKGEGYGDDMVDSVTLACSELPAVGRRTGSLGRGGAITRGLFG